MKNISKESNKVFNVIKQFGPIRSTEIVKKLNLSTKNVYKHLSKLLNEGLIKKTGSTPMVFYSIKIVSKNEAIRYDIDNEVIENNYIYVSPSGEMIMGIEGFQEWCKKNQFDFDKERKLLISKIKSFQKIKRDGLISAKKIILSGKKKLFLDNIFFSDFYNIGHFGKTKLGQLVYLGKSSQNKDLVIEVAKIIRPSLQTIINKYNIKLVCYIPPTIDRKTQFMDVLKKNLKLDLLEIKAIKVPSSNKIPQKTLRKLEDRIINAQKTIAINPNQLIDSNVLIIDDATGSGATMNETAGKIRNIATKKIKIFGYSVVGSYKGFDIISEV
jgi:sugar-specific transcriptional regulator TrmB